jgi:hypothetical protein
MGLIQCSAKFITQVLHKKHGNRWILQLNKFGTVLSCLFNSRVRTLKDRAIKNQCTSSPSSQTKMGIIMDTYLAVKLCSPYGELWGLELHGTHCGLGLNISA